MLLAISLLLFVLSLQPPNVQTRNVSIDSSSSLISYFPVSSWQMIWGNLDAGGSHRMTMDKTAYAIINYTFISFHFMSARWPHRVTTRIYVDDTHWKTVDLQNGGAESGERGGILASSVVASYIGAANMEHRIRIAVPPGDDFAIVDMFIFEIPDTLLPTATSSSAHSVTLSRTSSVEDTTLVPSPTSSSNPKGTSSASRNLPIAFGVASMGLTLVAMFIFLIWRLCCRKRQDTNDPGLPTSAIGGPPTPPTSPTSHGPPIPSWDSAKNTQETRIASILQSEFGVPASVSHVLRTCGTFSTTLYPTIPPSTPIPSYPTDTLSRRAENAVLEHTQLGPSSSRTSLVPLPPSSLESFPGKDDLTLHPLARDETHRSLPQLGIDAASQLGNHCERIDELPPYSPKQASVGSSLLLPSLTVSLTESHSHPSYCECSRTDESEVMRTPPAILPSPTRRPLPPLPV